LERDAVARFHDLDHPPRLGVLHPGVSSYVFSGAGYAIGRFHLPAGHARWGRLNYSGGTLLAFPRRPVRLGVPGRTPSVADPTVAVFYQAGQTYTRECLSGDGDIADFLTVPDAVADEMGLPLTRSATELRAFPVPDASYSDLLILISEVERQAHPDEADVRERVFTLMGSVVDRKMSTKVRPLGARARAARLEVVEGLKVAFGQRVGTPWGLDEMAKEFGVTTAHLCRIFRDATGMTIHTYRERLALRVSLESLSRAGSDITDLALDLGFSSHSHFTGRFGRYFGSPPSAIRSRLTCRPWPQPLPAGHNRSRIPPSTSSRRPSTPPRAGGRARREEA